jgi:hypothetical protein
MIDDMYLAMQTRRWKSMDEMDNKNIETLHTLGELRPSTQRMQIHSRGLSNQLWLLSWGAYFLRNRCFSLQTSFSSAWGGWKLRAAAESSTLKLAATTHGFHISDEVG